MVTASIRAAVLVKNNTKLPAMATAIIPSRAVLLRMCQNLQEIRQVHAQIVVSGLVHRAPHPARLLESYVSASGIDEASSVFESIPSPDPFAYNTMIRGLILGKRLDDSLMLFNKLLSEGVEPDNHTYTFLLKACSHLKALSEGQQMHCQIIKAGIEPNTHVHSSLINMYSNTNNMESAEQVLAELAEQDVLAINAIITGYLKQGKVEIARKIFDTMSRKDGATWSIMVTGYTKNAMHEQALMIFEEMMASQIPLSEATLVSALSACSHLGNLVLGIYIHRYVEKNVPSIGSKLWTALVEMYAKCGWIEGSYGVFQKIPQKDVVAWGAIVSGFAQHGQATKCFELFDQMISTGVSPNGIIFISVLSACAHAGYIELGYHYFNQMVRRFKIQPSVEHYGCMVDLLGRAGRLADAEELISSMPETPNAIIWGALLNASKIHKEMKTGKHAYEQLSKLGELSRDRYKVAVQMFADFGEQEEANEIRKFIREKDIGTTSGMSFIQVDSGVHKFVVGDISHRKSPEIYQLLKGIS